MFWRPVAALLSLVLGVGATALVAAYILVAHDLSRPIQIIIAGLVYLASSYAAMVWLMGSESLKLALYKTRVTAQALAVAGLAFAAVWALGFFESGGLRCPDCESVSVSRIIDGDTLVVTGIGRVRLYGIDAPEVGERCSGDATEELRRLAGGRVRVEEGPRLIDPFGRGLRCISRAGGQSTRRARSGGGVGGRSD